MTNDNTRYNNTIKRQNDRLQNDFYPRDVILARYQFQSVCLLVSVTSRCCIERAGRTDVVFDTEASVEQSYIALRGNTAIYKIMALSSGSFY